MPAAQMPDTAATAPPDEFCNRHTNKPAQAHCAVCGKPICADCMAIFGYLCSVVCRYEAESRGIDVPLYKGQRIQAERRASRWTNVIVLLIALLILAALGAWAWFSLSGSKPRLVATLSLTEPAANTRMMFLAPKQLLLVTGARAFVHDFSSGKDTWSTPFSDAALGNAPASALPPNLPQVYVDANSIWVCLGNSVKHLDRATGAVKQTISIPPSFASFTANPSNLFIVSEPDETRRLITRIDLPSGEITRQEATVPRPEKHLLPNELPPNVQPTAGVLLSQALDEQKFNKPLDAQSSQFFSAGQNLVELRVKLTDPKVTWIQTIKPKGPSLINGATTAATSASAVEEEVFNDIKRDRTGGVRGVDESRYEVRLTRWINSQSVEWKGVATGTPSFFSLQTVDLLTAGGLGGSGGDKPAGTLHVFDKENKELFTTSLAYPIGDLFASNSAAGICPAVQTADTLYFFDQGVLTAFALPDGKVRWRLPSVGISGIQFDSHGMLYVDSTTAAPEDIQFSDQIKFEHTAPVILKVEPKSGKILWRAVDRGQACFLSGNFVYAESIRNGGMAIGKALRGALDAPEGDEPVYFHLYRLDPDTGHVLWNLYREHAPEDTAFQKNSFVLRFEQDVKYYKYLTFD
jgi:hypothetical protein